MVFGLFLFGITIRRRTSDEAFGFEWGFAILGGFVGAALFFAIDAGLKLLGG